MTSSKREGLTALEHIQIAVEAALEKKAEDVAVLDLRGLCGITDFFLICSGNSRRQVGAIAESIGTRLRENHVRPDHLEGKGEAEWVLMDYLDFVVHVFTRERRSFYALERIWSDAPRLDLLPTRTAGASPARPHP